MFCLLRDWFDRSVSLGLPLLDAIENPVIRCVVGGSDYQSCVALVLRAFLIGEPLGFGDFLLVPL